MTTRVTLQALREHRDVAERIIRAHSCGCKAFTPTAGKNAAAHSPRGRTSAIGVRREKAALSCGCKPHPANAPAGSNRSSQRAYAGLAAEDPQGIPTPKSATT